MPDENSGNYQGQTWSGNNECGKFHDSPLHSFWDVKTWSKSVVHPTDRLTAVALLRALMLEDGYFVSLLGGNK